MSLTPSSAFFALSLIVLYFRISASKRVSLNPIECDRCFNIGRNHGVEDVEDVNRISSGFIWRFNLERLSHVLHHLMTNCLQVFTGFMFLFTPFHKILCDFLLNVPHVQPSAANGDGREGNISDWFVRALQSGCHLIHGLGEG